MPTSAWNHPRQDLIRIGVALALKGYDIMSVADHMTIRHFEGQNLSEAKKNLAGAIARQFYMQHGGRTERQQEISAMATQLYAEGWKPTFDRDNERCFWYHVNTGLSVNSNGGFFYNYAAATRAAFESATRAILREE